MTTLTIHTDNLKALEAHVEEEKLTLRWVDNVKFLAGTIVLSPDDAEMLVTFLVTAISQLREKECDETYDIEEN